MSDSIKEAIKYHAQLFRTALDKCPKSNLPIQFEKFPKGACGDTSLILAKYLKSVGLGQFEYVIGERGRHMDGSWHSHAWLRQSNLIIDITADQFPEVENRVIVSTDSPWHKNFKIKNNHSADLENYDGHSKAVLSVIFYKVLEYLETT